MFYDAHTHMLGKEVGRFIIGLEGNPVFPDTITNEQALALHDPQNKCIGFYYVTADALMIPAPHGYLKYHARREHYTPQQVIDSIRVINPTCVMIDTLNEPYWRADDYWLIARTFPEIVFIFPHSGGYLINEFIKICHFQKNVWIDFSLTHTVLGKFGKGLPMIEQAIVYALDSAFSDRVLLGSDAPFFHQDDVVSYYQKLGKIEMLNKNFETLLEMIK